MDMYIDTGIDMNDCMNEAIVVGHLHVPQPQYLLHVKREGPERESKRARERARERSK